MEVLKIKKSVMLTTDRFFSRKRGEFRSGEKQRKESTGQHGRLANLCKIYSLIFDICLIYWEVLMTP